MQHLLIYPSLHIPGTQVEFKSEKYWILCNHGNNVILSNGKDHVEANHESCVPVVNYDFNKQLFSEALRTYENENIYPLTYRVDRPPKSLLLILKQCQQYNIDIDELTQRIEKEPSFSRFMCESATNSNRLKISVSSVKQAIMTYGTERLGDMLTTHALFERLTQNSFPLKDAFISHVTLSMEIAAYLAKETQLILPQTASLLTLLCHSPLFTNATVKNITSWETVNVEQHGFKHLIKEIPIDDLRTASMNLAKAWGTSPAHITAMSRVLTDSNTPTSSSSAIIQLSLEWSTTIRHGSFSHTRHSTPYEKKLSKYLGVTLSSKATCVHGLSELLYCNLVKR
nr:HDOD domain-containing protein [Alteromonas sp. 5E99-2]